MWLMLDELGRGVVPGSPMGFSERSGKTSHIVSHSRSISAMSLCRLACKEELVKVIEALIDQRVRRYVGGSKGLNGRWLGLPLKS